MNLTPVPRSTVFFRKLASELTLHILHLHGHFDHGRVQARSAMLMNGFGDGARHTVVSAIPGAIGARAAIGKRIKAEFPTDHPPLGGRPSVARYQALARYMRRFDLVLTHGWEAIDAVMARRLFPSGLPMLIHHEGGFSGEEARRLKFERTVYQRIALTAAHALVLPSESLARVARGPWKQPDYRLKVIQPGIAVQSFGKRPDPRALPGVVKTKGEILIGTVASLTPDSNLIALVRAVSALKIPARLVIVGDGPERHAITKESEKQGVSLVLVDGRNGPERFLGLFDIFAIASDREQFPLSLVQALATGLPVVATDTGDIASIVSAENTPYVVPRGDEAALASAMAALAEDDDLRCQLGAKNRAKAVTDYDEKTMIARYAALYGGAVGRSAALMPGG